MRWCTDRLKIQPASDYIKRHISESNAAIVVLGVRIDESYFRQRSIEKHQKHRASKLAPHNELLEGLISSNQSNDRNLLLSGNTVFRRLLPSDAKAPLRKQFLDGEDKEIYRIVADFFRAFSDVLWKDAKPHSFIFRTVGILASFDILKLALSAGKMDTNDTYAATKTMILAAEAVDFADNFFMLQVPGEFVFEMSSALLLR